MMQENLKCQVLLFTAQKANENTVHMPTLHNIMPAVPCPCHTHWLWLLCDAAAETNPELSHSEADKEATAVSSLCSDVFTARLPVQWLPDLQTQARN